MSEADEAALALNAAYLSRGVHEAIERKRKKLIGGVAGFVVSALLLILTLYLAIDGADTPLLVSSSIALLASVAASVWLVWSSRREPLPVRRVKTLTKMPWTVGVYPLAARTVVVDKSGFLPEMSLKFPFTTASPIQLQEIMDEIDAIVHRRPLLMKRMETNPSDPELQELQGLDEAQLRNALQRLADRVGSVQDKVVDLPAVASSSSVVELVREQLPTASAADGPSPFVADRDAGQAIETLEALSSQGQGQDSEDDESVDGTTRGLVTFADSKDAELKEIDEVRADTLIEILAEQLKKMTKLSTSSVRLFFCPYCYKRAEFREEVASDDDGEGLLSSSGTGVLEGLKETGGRADAFVLSSRLMMREVCARCERPIEQPSSPDENRSCKPCGIVFTRDAVEPEPMEAPSSQSLGGGGWLDQMGAGDATLPENRTDIQWHCSLCTASWFVQEVTPLEDFPSTLKIKEQVILPLWDVLWSELANEKARIIREKEAEHRANNSAENNELQTVSRDFAQDRRDLRGRLDEVSQTSVTAVSTFEGVIQAFQDAEMLNPSDAEALTARAEQYAEAHTETIEVIRAQLLEVEEQIAHAVDTRKGGGGRGAIIDPVDEIKVRGRFFMAPRPESEPVAVVSSEAPEAAILPDAGTGFALEAGVTEQRIEDAVEEASTGPTRDAPQPSPQTNVREIVNSASRRCPNCQATISGDDLFCIRCGASRPKDPPIETAPRVDTTPRISGAGNTQAGKRDFKVTIDGDIASGSEVELLLRMEGEPVRRADVYVDDQQIGTTDATGRVPFVLASEYRGTALKVRAFSPRGGGEWMDGELRLPI